MESVACNLCGSLGFKLLYRMPDTLVFKDEWFDVVECQGCGLGFVNPRPTINEIGRFYPPAYYEWFQTEKKFNDKRYEIEAAYVHRYLKASPTRLLMDVGCANGAFPRVMQRFGWNVEGVEVSTSSAPITDFPVYRQIFPDIPVREPRYHVVTAWAVLEHVHDPGAYFKKAAEVLHSGGIFVVNVPNFGSVSSRHLYREDIPRHLYFFSETNIRRYLSVNGMELLEAFFDDRIYSTLAYNWLHYYLRFKRIGRNYTYEDSLFCRDRYLKEKGLPPTPINSIRFFAANPHIPFDRLFRRAFEKYQMRKGTYGQATYIARKV
jgi:2-polyprenyl-3-methyl-5-hydroxy-6-metoxy-1,4-benzoquinol methylase